MTVRGDLDGLIALEGECPSGDAEELLARLCATPDATVDIRNCERAHTAVIQVLLACKPQILGPAAGDFLRQWLEPALAAG